ncbi:hypothetical protein H8959_014940, partial [Pygathrix nigripes]
HLTLLYVTQRKETSFQVLGLIPVPLEEWMMMILVVLRLRRLLMVEMVKLKQRLLLFLGLPFLQ